MHSGLLIAAVGRFSIAAVFWKMDQAKIDGEFRLGWPRLSDSAFALFRDEFRLPLIPSELAAPMEPFAEHLFPLLYCSP